MKGGWSNCIHGDGVFGRWWRRQWRLLLSAVQRRLMPLPLSRHWHWWRWQRGHCRCRHWPPLPLTTTAIAAINNHHCRCHTVDGQLWRRSSSMAPAMVRADMGKGGWGCKGEGARAAGRAERVERARSRARAVRTARVARGKGGKGKGGVGSYKLPLGQYTCIGRVVACSFQQG